MSSLEKMLEGLKIVAEGIKQAKAVVEANGKLTRLSEDIIAVWKEVKLLPDDSLHEEYKDSVSKLNKWADDFKTHHLKDLNEKCMEAEKLFEKIHMENDAAVTNDDVKQMVTALESTADAMSTVSKLLHELKPLLEKSEKEAEFIIGKREEEAKKLQTKKSDNNYSGYGTAGAVAAGAAAVALAPFALFAAPVAAAAGVGAAVVAGGGTSCFIASHTYINSSEIKKEADDLESKAEDLRQHIFSLRSVANSMDGAVKLTDDAVKALRSALEMYQRDMQQRKQLKEKEKEIQKLKEKLETAGIDVSSDKDNLANE